MNLRDKASDAVKGMDVVINLACNMGGMGFIELNKGLCMISVLINTHLLLGAREHGVKRFFYASSACVYNGDKQKEQKIETFLKEEDAYPAMPEDGYGWEKLFSERMCRHFREDFKVPHARRPVSQRLRPIRHMERRPRKSARQRSAAKSSRQSSPANMTSKSGAMACRRDPSCTSPIASKGIYMITESETWHDPINLGSDEGVTINQLVDIVEDIAGIKLKRSYNLSAPKGVAGRNSDNTLIKKVFNWEPNTKLRDGMEKTYKWIYDQMTSK